MPFLQTYSAIAFVVAISIAILVFVKAVVKAWHSEPLLTKTTLANPSELAWWVKIITSQPKCTYFFGPFGQAKEAEAAQKGYLEDLQQEGAEGIKVEIEWSQPRELTLADEWQNQGSSPDFELLSLRG